MIATLAQVTIGPSGGPTVVVDPEKVSGFFWVFFVLIAILAVASLVFWIWALVDAIRVPDDRYYQSGTKLVWVLVIVLLQVIGAFVYLVAGRPSRPVRESIAAGEAPPRGMPPPPPPPPSAGTA